MSELDWSKIKTGATFQALASVILRHEDEKARIYDRPGKDAAIDMKSGDGTCVYQAKYVRDQKFSRIISESLNELEKIKEYRLGNHPNKKFWEGVSKWCLITNAVMNPGDEIKWNDEVVNKFKEEGFEDVYLWHQAVIAEKLIKYPDIKREYFETENRVLLSLSEAYERLLKEEILTYSLDIPFYGRDDKFKEVLEFIDDTEMKVLPIHGAGGVGKTRFALEIGTKASLKEWGDVYWANVNTMAADSRWLTAVVTSRKTLLILDEPEDPNLIKILLEQIASIRLNNWKIVVVVRSSNDPILAPLKKPKLKLLAKEIKLEALQKGNSESMTYSLLKKSPIFKETKDGDLKEWSKRISNLCNHYPVWITISISLLEKGKNLNDLPADEYSLAMMYLEEILIHVPNELNGDVIRYKEFIQWIALFQPINREKDNSVIAFIYEDLALSRQSYIDSLFDNLLKRNFAFQRGRLIEIKPDVIRDYVLHDWLVKNQKNSIELVRRILSNNKFPESKRALKQLGILEVSYKLKGENFSVLSPVINELCGKAQNGNLIAQHNVLEIASEVCIARPTDFVRLSKILRNNFKENKLIKHELGEFEITHKDLILNLPWELYKIGKYAYNNDEIKTVFEELLEIARYEALNIKKKESYLENDGKRALHLVSRLIIGEIEQVSTYEDVAYNWLIHKLEKLKNELEKDTGILSAISKTILQIERRDSYFSDGTFIFRTYQIHPNLSSAKRRSCLRSKLWEIVSSADTSVQTRIFLWKLLVVSHQSVNVASDPWNRKDSKYKVEWEKEIEDDLEKVLDFLKSRKIALEEGRFLHEIWSWHFRFDKRQHLKDISDECEKLFLENEEIRDFNQLFTYERHKNKKDISKEIAHKILNKDEFTIEKFVNDSFEFAGKDKFWYGAAGVAHFLGESYQASDKVQDFVKDVLNKSNDKTDEQLSFAFEILAVEVKRIREELPDKLKEFILKVAESLANNDLVKRWYCSLYTAPHPEISGLLIEQDFDVLEEFYNRDYLDQSSLSNLMYTFGYMFDVNFKRVQENIAKIWCIISARHTAKCFNDILKGISYRSIFKVDCIPDLFNWILEQLKNVVFLEDLGEDLEYDFSELKKKSKSSISIKWYTDFLNERVSKYGGTEGQNEKLRSRNFQIVKFVDKVKREEKADPQIIECLKELLQINFHKSILGFELPEIIKNLDPEGFILPDLILEKIENREFRWEKPKGYEWTRYAGQYQINSPAWREIAKKACEYANGLEHKEKVEIYSSLLPSGIISWEGPYGEFNPRWQQEIQIAKEDSCKEQDPDLKKFFEWRLKVAQDDFDREKLRFEEDER